MADFDVFLSHNSVDKPWVIQLKDDLTRYDLRVWLDKDEIRPGDLFAQALEEALDNCSAIALIISPEAMNSGWVKEEYYRAVSLSKDKQLPLQIIPVILREAEVPGFVKSRNWIDFRDGSKYSENVWKLVWGIRGHKPREVLDLTAPTYQPPIRQPDHQTQRYLDAAISRKIKVGQTTELVVLVRLPGSAGLRALITKDGHYHVQPEDVKTKEFPIEFPVDHRGKQLPLKLCIEIETTDFVVAERRKLIELEAEKDTQPCVFLLTAEKRGSLKILVQVYLVPDELLLATGILNVNGATKLDQGIQNLKALISIPLGVFGVGTKKSIEPKLDVSEPGELHTQKRISEAKPDTSTLLRTEMADLRNDQQHASLWPLLDFLEPLVSQPAYESDREIDKELRTVLTQLQLELKRGADHRTRVGKMLGGFIQNDWTVNGDVQQAGRDVVINKIKQLKIVIQENRSKLDDLEIRETVADLSALALAEQRCRERIRERFAEDAFYYIPLAGEITEPAKSQAATRVPHSVRRRRQRIAPEFCEWMEEGREIRRVRLDNLREAVDKYPCVILLGDPGCGKTTALEHLAHELAGKDGRLPLPLRLSAFEPGMNMEDFICDGWAGPENANHWNWNSPELAAGLNAYLEAGKLFFLFDALNEMPHEGYTERTRDLRRFINRWLTKGNRFVVTCRVLDYGEELSGLKRVEIQPFSNDQIQDFLRKDLPGTWKDLWQQLIEDSDAQRSLLKLGRNPFMLSVMVQVFDTDGRLGRNRGDLMDRFTQILMDELARPSCSPDQWLDADVQRSALARLAFEIQVRPRLGTTVKKIQAESLMPQQVNLEPDLPPLASLPDQVLDLAASAHIIEMTGNKSSLRFYHQLLQEYFAACEMLKRDPAGLEKLWRWPWLEKEMPPWVRPEDNWDPLPPPPPTNWEETTILAAGLMPENDDQVLRALIQVNPVLAGRCLHEGRAEAAPDVRQAVVERLLATISDPEVALRVRIAAGEVLGHLGDPRLGELVTIAEGPFLMGDDEDDDAKPQHEIYLPEYQIGKYPVTNAGFAKFIKAGGYKDKHWWTAAGWMMKEENNWSEPGLWDDDRFNKRANQPVVGVSWYECLAYCGWLRVETGQPYCMPSEAQWEKAARGIDDREFPWGDEFEPSRSNCDEGDQTVMATSPVGIYSNGASPYGCLDMAGNVWEWTSSHFVDYPYDPADGRENVEAGNEALRVLRGGSWNNPHYSARCSSRYRYSPDYRYSDRGFRVVVSPISAH